MALYAANGSINITVVDGTTRTGLIAPDGSRYVVVSAGTSPVGVTHPCGAWWVTNAPLNTPTGSRAPDGSMYVSTTNKKDGTLFVTVVSGSLGSAAPEIPDVTDVVITGTPEVGQALTATPTTTGTGTITYQWTRGSSHSKNPIFGAVTNTHTLTTSDLNKEVAAIVSKGNRSGSKSKTSNSIFVPEIVIPDWVPEGAVIHIDLVGGAPQGRAWTATDGEVAVDTLLGADENTANYWDTSGWNAANLIAGEGYVYIGDPPAFIGDARTKFFDGTVVIRFKQHDTGAPSPAVLAMSADGNAAIEVDLNTSSTHTVNAYSDGGSFSIETGAVLNVGQGSLNAVSFTLTTARMDLAANGTTALTGALDETDIPVESPLVAALIDSFQALQSITLYDPLPSTSGLSELSEI